jgi:hypothetical protein
MIRTIFLLSLAALASGATLTISCIDTLNVATLTWSGATGPVQIIVGKPTGTPLTGVVGTSGTAITGPWISDGLMFYLVDQSGNVEASVTANVYCSSLPPTVDQGLASSGYFPLAVGNTWVYKTNDRLLTASYVVQTISSQVYQAGQIYYVLTQTTPTLGLVDTLAMLRSDSNGVIYQYVNGADQVYLDPTSSGIASYTGALGTFTDAIIPPSQFNGGLIQTTSTYARGIGMVNSQSQMLSGSSGGFLQSLDLVDVKVNGFHLSLPVPKISLSIDNPSPNLSAQLAPNCAVPCYFVACALAPGADPPGTYRPCGQVRIDTSAEVPFYTVLVQLLDSTGTAVFQNSSQSATPASLNYIRLPLYTGQTPFTLLPPGIYSLVGKMLLGTTTLATSTIPVQVQ